MKQDLAARRQQSESMFNELVKQREQKQKVIDDTSKELQEIDSELARLQGEWRLINELIDEDKPKSKNSKVSPKPEILDVTEIEGA